MTTLFSINKILIVFSKTVNLNHLRCFHRTNVYLKNKTGTNSLLNNHLFTKEKVKSLVPATKSMVQGIQEKLFSLQIKKGPVRKKRVLCNENQKPPGLYNVLAFATADEYKLKGLIQGLKMQDLYVPKHVDSSLDVVYAITKDHGGHEPRELFFFREGAVIMWNFTDLESSNVLSFLKQYEQDGYPEGLLLNEAELMNYGYLDEGKPSLSPTGEILITPGENLLEKYTFSNAMALSVKLGIWEASLEKLIDGIQSVTEDLKQERKIKMTQEEALRKYGELFALRHVINLSSDFLDTPDFYWDRDQLEALYSQTCAYFTIAKRARIMNEKIDHCVELIELLSSHLSEKHGVRLVRMIIVVMVKVGFEIIHYLERFMN